MTIEKEHVFKRHLLENGINLFLGAGFSYDAYNKEEERLPLGNELKDQLIKHFGLDDFRSFNLSQLSNLIKRNQRGDFHRFLYEKYRVSSFSESYKSLDKIRIKNIFTLNIDDLVEKIYSQQDMNNILYDVSISGSIDNQGIDFHKLHGSITYPNDKELLFTPEELSILFTKEPALFHSVALKIASKPTLFWGTQMEDANVLALLAKETTRGFEPQEKWIVITPDSKNDANAMYFQSMNFNIIRAYTKDLLNYFNEITLSSDEISDKIQPSRTSKLIDQHFHSNYTTLILKKKHPVRPISSFFTGDDPVWSDVISGNIIKLSIYNDCLSRAHKNNLLLITGGIGTGKSTLLMQLSIDNELEGMKFYFNSITKVKALKLNSILKELPGPKYLFIDNLSNNLDAFKYLYETENYTIICADRDINYDMIKHIVKFQNENILDITELTNKDIQGICDIAHNTTFRNYNTKMSLFELTYYIWEGKKLSDKIIDLIQTLSNNQEYHHLLEFFTLMTYIRYSGISASMDMLLLYYSDDNLHYSKIYEYVNSLKSMIDDTDHYTINKEQDFFTLRSKLFAELSLKQLPAEIIASVLMKFINNVHRDIIVRYDVFKRRGYDADIAVKAFIDVKDGIDFYEKVLKMDQSEYRYQQYALYLFRKHYYEFAWEQIEMAHSINPYNLAVLNTHAYILFQNNIRIDENIELVKKTLDDTFEIIDKCINKDLRKTFHVITFSENAIQYYNKFIDSPYSEEAPKYLHKAYKYIISEIEGNDFISRTNKRKLHKSKKEIEAINMRI